MIWQKGCSSFSHSLTSARASLSDTIPLATTSDSFTTGEDTPERPIRLLFLGLSSADVPSPASVALALL